MSRIVNLDYSDNDLKTLLAIRNSLRSNENCTSLLQFLSNAEDFVSVFGDPLTVSKEGLIGDISSKIKGFFVDSFKKLTDKEYRITKNNLKNLQICGGYIEDAISRYQGIEMITLCNCDTFIAYTNAVAKILGTVASTWNQASLAGIPDSETARLEFVDNTIGKSDYVKHDPKNHNIISYELEFTEMNFLDSGWNDKDKRAEALNLLINCEKACDTLFHNHDLTLNYVKDQLKKIDSSEGESLYLRYSLFLTIDRWLANELYGKVLFDPYLHVITQNITTAL